MIDYNTIVFHFSSISKSDVYAFAAERTKTKHFSNEFSQNAHKFASTFFTKYNLLWTYSMFIFRWSNYNYSLRRSFNTYSLNWLFTATRLGLYYCNKIKNYSFVSFKLKMIVWWRLKPKVLSIICQNRCVSTRNDFFTLLQIGQSTDVLLISSTTDLTPSLECSFYPKFRFINENQLIGHN